MNPTIEQLMTRIEQLENKLKQFESAGQLDPLYVKTITQILSNPSTKLSNSENGSQGVNEAGASSYTITFLNPPDRFIRIGDNNVPAYD